MKITMQVLCSNGIGDGAVYLVSPHQLVKILPKVLSHQSKQWQECPTECIKTCVAIVGVSTSFHTYISFWTLTTKEEEMLFLTTTLNYDML